MIRVYICNGCEQTVGARDAAGHVTALFHHDRACASHSSSGCTHAGDCYRVESVEVAA